MEINTVLPVRRTRQTLCPAVQPRDVVYSFARPPARNKKLRLDKKDDEERYFVAMSSAWLGCAGVTGTRS